MKNLIILIITLMSFSCSRNDDSIAESFSGDIGDFYQGGIVFYLDSTGAHGLIASPKDHTSELPWGCYNTVLSAPDGETAKPIGHGAKNTEDFMLFCLDNVGTAGEYCSSLSLNNYDDWFLPSINELTEMYHKRNVINTTAITNGGNMFVDGEYWSSTGVDPSLKAYTFLFDGADLTIDRKDALHYVRAIRAF